MSNFRYIQFLQSFVFLTLTVLSHKCCCSSVSTAVTENNFIDTVINKSENLLCRIPDDGVRICLWTHSDFGIPSKPLNLFEFMKGNDSKGSANFLYYGKGMENGDCGIQISKIEKRYLGFWNCTLISENNDIFLASIQVKLSEASIMKPTLEKSTLENLIVDENTGIVPSRNISCCSCACDPHSKLELILDHVPITESGYNITTAENDGTICLTWPDVKLKRENNGKLLQCKVHPQNLTSEELLTDSIYLNIKHSPVFLEREGSFILDVSCDAESVNISIGFSGNPIPDMIWHLKEIGESETFSAVLDNGSKYSVQRHSVGNDRYVAELIIEDFQKHDLDYEYVLNVTNTYGHKIITIRLKQDYIDCYNLLIIVGAILFVLFAIVTIGLLIWATKTRRFCCQKTTKLPITKRASRPVQKQSKSTYKNVSTVDTIPDCPDSAEENDTPAIPNTRSSIVTEIH